MSSPCGLRFRVGFLSKSPCLRSGRPDGSKKREKMLPRISLILGGASSGKSVFAENLLLGSETRPVYVATAQAWDREMEEKISIHRQRRKNDWVTIEEPYEVARVLRDASADSPILVDCLTIWLSNHVIEGHDAVMESRRLVETLKICKAQVVLVSNEVGQGVVPETSLGRSFRNYQGTLNQELSAIADSVALIVAGLPLVLKGTLPGA
ncbi:MAG: bifunctional adenosylcobinamide kinase/adenosylcobinamide-phosphate guanylyltransferase [Pseudomonadota bacterium]